MKWERWRFIALLMLTSASALPGLQQGAHSHGSKSAMEPGWSELMGSMEKMHVAMASAEPSNDNDVDFVKLMLIHHQAAIDMAKTQLLYGKDAQVRRLAQEIVTDQQSEIDLMQLWLKQHRPDSPQVKQALPSTAIREQ
jgi:uncharacterized protein (DUF305 family)